MILWRISNHPDLNGQGGLLYEGRWHGKGHRVVYLATHPASALLEVLVHLEIETVDDLPDSYQLLEIEIPDTASVEQAVMPAEWKSGYPASQPVGNAWLARGSSLLLEVPSALVPSSNFLFNPAHPEAALAKIKSVRKYPYDPRLVKVSRTP